MAGVSRMKYYRPVRLLRFSIFSIGVARYPAVLENKNRKINTSGVGLTLN